MQTITIMDPVTRIEGHMKVKVTIDQKNGQLQVVDAWCTGTLFRGFETILKGRDPWDAPIITERICGVCPVSHGMAAVKALDAAAGKNQPDNARILRNLVLGANYVQSHILHFYLLAALDYVAGPGSAPWTPAWNVDLVSHPALTAVSNHLPQAIEARRRAHEMGAVFGGKMPLPHTYIPGGFTAVPTADRITRFRNNLNWLIKFIGSTYIEDVKVVAAFYSDYHSIGKGCGNLLAYGVFDENQSGSNKLLKQGWVSASSPMSVNPLSLAAIREEVTYSWYDSSTNNMNPSSGATKPVFPKGDAYSWLKAPRYNGQPFETGPLARMWINGDHRGGVSVMDRHMARALEALKVATVMNDWLDELNVGDAVHDDSYDTPASGSGMGLTEAPRGALGHWVQIKDSKISNYQVITPTCWNASPRDGKAVPGPMEQALIGTPIKDPAQPVEALRVIHSFDPCLSCAVHVMRPGGRPVVLSAGCR
jgi:hydrogenase large subunit